jgi:hypothetical protein
MWILLSARHIRIFLLQAPDVKPMVFENRLPVTDVPRLHICGFPQKQGTAFQARLIKGKYGNFFPGGVFFS